MRNAAIISFLAPLMLTGCATAGSERPAATQSPAAPSYPEEATRIVSEVDAQRLLHNKGITLQWIDWNTRGSAFIEQRNGLWRLRGSQAEASGPGRLFVDGRITEIGAGYFTFDGTIRITDTPDRGRSCEVSKTWHFAITQSRPYYRLREFEWCDDLTDYIDIYF